MNEKWRLIENMKQVAHVSYIYELLKDKKL